MSFSEYRGSEAFQNQQSTSPASTASETYSVGGVTYSVETGLPVEVTDGPPSITSQVPVGNLPGTSFQNQLYGIFDSFIISKQLTRQIVVSSLCAEDVGRT